MVCDILDIRCIFVNEIVGSVFLSVLLLMIVLLFISSKLKFGFSTTVFFIVPASLMLGVALGGFSAIFAFLTLLVGVLISLTVDRIIRNR